MRVVFLIDGLAGIGGGVTTYLNSVMAEVPTHGIEPIIVAGQPSGTSFAGTQYVHVPGIEQDRARLRGGERSRLRTVLAELAPDIVYAHVVLPEAISIAAQAAPTVVYAHEYLTVCPGGGRYLEHSRRFCEEGPGARCFRRAYTERCTNRRPDRLSAAYARTMAWRETWPDVSRILVASPFVGDVVSAGGAPQDRIAVVPYPVEPPPRVAATGLTDVLYLGRLIPSKGVDVLLKALSRLDGVTAVIAGDGPGRDDLERQSDKLGLSSRVEFTGWISGEERAQRLAGARLLVVPSLWDEAFGIVGVEAFGAGVPVIGADVGGIPSWLSDGVAGFLFPRGDHEALAAKIALVLGDADLEERLRACSPREAGRFTMARHLDLLLSEFRAVAR